MLDVGVRIDEFILFVVVYSNYVKMREILFNYGVDVNIKNL